MRKLREPVRAATAVPPIRLLAGAALARPARWAGGLASGLIGLTLARLGRYRSLSQDERADAVRVFGASIDLDRVRIAQPGWLHRVMFAAQRILQGGGQARAFVTGFHVHVAPGTSLPRALLIHELTHVWQSRVYGPCYLWQALHAQHFGAGYDYGPRVSGDTAQQCGALGEGAQEALLSCSFFAFNREQQAQIVMHYFVRRFVLNQSEETCAPWSRHARALREPGSRDS